LHPRSLMECSIVHVKSFTPYCSNANLTERANQCLSRRQMRLSMAGDLSILRFYFAGLTAEPGVRE
jgi:hypothetical protein